MEKSKHSWQLKVLLTLVLGLVLFGCGVKERELQGQPSPVVGGNLPEGVWTTEDKKFLVRPSSHTFELGEFTVTYKFVTSDIDLPSPPDYTFTVHYWMPDMPEMPVTPAKIEVVSPGQVKITYDISMGGLWKATLNIQKNGTQVDTLTYSYKVPE